LNKLILIALSSLMGAALAIGIVSLVPDEPSVQRVVEHAHSVADPEFAPTMEGILGAAIEPGNRIETLVNGHEIFPAMLAAIGEARKTINFETYIYWSGDIAERFAEALSERARAGVRVNVILDYVGSLPMEERLIERMQEAGVKLVRFRPLHWYTIDRLNYRSHHKLLVIDGRLGFTGGVGIADEWKGDARNPKEWRDNHYRLEGGIVAGLQSAFADHWLETTGEVLRGEAHFPPLETRGSVALQSMKSSPFSGNQTLYLLPSRACWFDSGQGHQINQWVTT
jgi:cardiolipin synthase A/B